MRLYPQLISNKKSKLRNKKNKKKLIKKSNSKRIKKSNNKKINRKKKINSNKKKTEKINKKAYLNPLKIMVSMPNLKEQQPHQIKQKILNAKFKMKLLTNKKPVLIKPRKYKINIISVLSLSRFDKSKYLFTVLNLYYLMLKYFVLCQKL